MRTPLSVKEDFLLSYQFAKTDFVTFQKIHKKDSMIVSYCLRASYFLVDCSLEIELLPPNNFQAWARITDDECSLPLQS